MKICIVGPSGAGKTTIAKKLAEELKISAHAFDEIYWDLSGTEFVKNSEETISVGINKISLQESWIVEGAYDKRLEKFLSSNPQLSRKVIYFNNFSKAINVIQRGLK
ncbi:AAA family ATPase [Acinetobacter calcoaceticus]|uniref:AAA family ATPase n=1 Tax=Acinetobacter calcoaceticus TaxID=471 RepID=UPI0030097D64